MSEVIMNALWLEIKINQSLKAATNLVAVPVNMVDLNSTASDALTDSERRTDFDLLKGNVETISISPWHQGDFNGSKQDANFWLSPTDAQTKLVEQLKYIAWESCVVLVATGKDANQLSTNLENILAVFPNNDLEISLRHATSLATHENQKLFVPGIKQDDRKKQTLEKLGVFSSLLSAKQNLAVSEAVASDQDTNAMLTAFKEKRVARLDEIKTAVEAIADKNGTIEDVIYLTGGDLSSKMKNIEMKDQNAPLCCLLALGGTASDLAPLVEVMGL